MSRKKRKKGINKCNTKIGPAKNTHRKADLKLLNFKLRKNNLHGKPGYKYELDIDTDNVDLMSLIINSTFFTKFYDETKVTLYSSNKQGLLAEKERIQQLSIDLNNSTN